MSTRKEITPAVTQACREALLRNENGDSPRWRIIHAYRCLGYSWAAIGRAFHVRGDRIHRIYRQGGR